MNYRYSIFLLTLVLVSCTPLRQLKTIDSDLPQLGAVGYFENGMFSKGFRSVGKPRLQHPIRLSLKYRAFTTATYQAYTKVMDTTANQGEVPIGYYHLEIEDVIGLRETLNTPSNASLLAYLRDAPEIRMLTAMDFVPSSESSTQFAQAEYVQLMEIDGGLVLGIPSDEGLLAVSIRQLQPFDYGTSGFCWKDNGKGRTAIALLRPNGHGCPKGTVKKAYKLEERRNSLKF
ncbi:hypothetical protein ABV409_14985 [Flagellimonas sp. DF-77]|uniref:hypothetical protein n=1 Tax=Flagellimonas algarum TaxID=3230298 RepID=UPI003396C5CD